MKIILKEDKKYIVRFERSEELISGLENFCEKQKIRAGFFWGIGAASLVLLSAYDLDKQEYFDSRIEKGLEISSLFGNVSQMDKKTMIHAHGVFSDFDTRAHAGHVKELIVAATCEVLLEKLNGKIQRRFSKKIGLNLMK